jgi:hypothetical protein
MKKFRLVGILFLFLFIQQIHSEPNCCKRRFAVQHFVEDHLSFETREDYKYLMGILPSSEVYFNIIQEAFSANLVNKKIKDSSGEFTLLKTKIILNYSFLPNLVYSRYCSAFIHIYLRTACFRL